MQTPKLSIITVNLNNAEGLEKTIESVISQTFTDYEYIIIDGGSTDGSVEVIKKYTDKITYWVSEPDKGIYNGMNKGIKVATGEYCLFLNSGDWLFNDNVLEIFLSKTDNFDFIYGNVETDRGTYKYSSDLSLKTFFWGTICHQAAFIKRLLFKNYGLYNETLFITADWEFFLKTIIINRCTYKHIPEIVCRYIYDGISSNPVFFDRIEKEKKEVLEKIFPTCYNDFVFFKAINEEIHFYRNSRLIQLVAKFQKSNFYKKIRSINH